MGAGLDRAWVGDAEPEAGGDGAVDLVMGEGVGVGVRSDGECVAGVGFGEDAGADEGAEFDGGVVEDYVSGAVRGGLDVVVFTFDCLRDVLAVRA